MKQFAKDTLYVVAYVTTTFTCIVATCVVLAAITHAMR